MSTDGILMALAAADPENIRQDSASPLDPLLMLVILADLTGQSEDQDAGIVNLLNYQNQGDTYRGLMKDLLKSNLKPRKFALEALQKMAADSKSEDDPIERLGLARFDLSQKIVGLFVGEQLQPHQLFLL